MGLSFVHRILWNWVAIVCTVCLELHCVLVELIWQTDCVILGVEYGRGAEVIEFSMLHVWVECVCSQYMASGYELRGMNP